MYPTACSTSSPSSTARPCDVRDCSPRRCVERTSAWPRSSRDRRAPFGSVFETRRSFSSTATCMPRRARSLSSAACRRRCGWSAPRAFPRTRRPDLLDELALDVGRIEWLEHLLQLSVLAEPVALARVQPGEGLKHLRHLRLGAQIHLERHLFPKLGD